MTVQGKKYDVQWDIYRMKLKKIHGYLFYSKISKIWTYFSFTRDFKNRPHTPPISVTFTGLKAIFACWSFNFLLFILWIEEFGCIKDNWNARKETKIRKNCLLNRNCNDWCLTMKLSIWIMRCFEELIIWLSLLNLKCGWATDLKIKTFSEFLHSKIFKNC